MPCKPGQNSATTILNHLSSPWMPRSETATYGSKMPSDGFKRWANTGSKRRQVVQHFSCLKICPLVHIDPARFHGVDHIGGGGHKIIFVCPDKFCSCLGHLVN